MTAPPDARPATPSAARISRRPPSKRSVINQHQARHLVQLVRLLEREALAHFRVPIAAKLPKDRYAEFFRLEAYRIFIEGAYACGFVCRDLGPDNPLEGARGRAAAAIAGWSLTELRQYLNYLIRHERFASGYSSPILDALIAGHLQQVAERLESDESL